MGGVALSVTTYVSSGLGPIGIWVTLARTAYDVASGLTEQWEYLRLASIAATFYRTNRADFEADPSIAKTVLLKRSQILYYDYQRLAFTNFAATLKNIFTLGSISAAKQEFEDAIARIEAQPAITSVIPGMYSGDSYEGYGIFVSQAISPLNVVAGDTVTFSTSLRHSIGSAADSVTLHFKPPGGGWISSSMGLVSSTGLSNGVTTDFVHGTSVGTSSTGTLEYYFEAGFGGETIRYPEVGSLEIVVGAPPVFESGYDLAMALVSPGTDSRVDPSSNATVRYSWGNPGLTSASGTVTWKLYRPDGALERSWTPAPVNTGTMIPTFSSPTQSVSVPIGAMEGTWSVVGIVTRNGGGESNYGNNTISWGILAGGRPDINGFTAQRYQNEAGDFPRLITGIPGGYSMQLSGVNTSSGRVVVDWVKKNGTTIQGRHNFDPYDIKLYDNNQLAVHYENWSSFPPYYTDFMIGGANNALTASPGAQTVRQGEIAEFRLSGSEDLNDAGALAGWKNGDAIRAIDSDSNDGNDRIFKVNTGSLSPGSYEWLTLVEGDTNNYFQRLELTVLARLPMLNAPGSTYGPGQAVTLGGNYLGGSGTLYINGASTSTSSWSNGSITFDAPQAGGTHLLHVVNTAGTSNTVTLVVDSSPVFELQNGVGALVAASYDFGSLELGGSSSVTTFRLANTGNTDLVIGNIGSPGEVTHEVKDSTGRAIGSPVFSIPVGSYATLSLSYTPSDLGADSLEFSFDTSDPDHAEVNLSLTGLGRDTTAPVVAILYPSGESVSTINPVAVVSGSFSDFSPVNLAYKVNGGTSTAITPVGNSWSIQNLNLVVGDNVVVVTATDTTGNAASDSVTFVYAVPYTLTLAASPVSGGIVTGGGSQPPGKLVAASAVENDGYTFTEWQENGNPVSSDQDYEFTLNGDRTLVAVFESLQPRIVVTPSEDVMVVEGETTNIGVTLSAAPQSEVTVAVAWLNGDSDLSVSVGASLTFTTSNWSTPQTVTFQAAQDDDLIDGIATFGLTGPGLTGAEITVSEQDDDLSGLVVTPADSISVPEGGEEGFTVALSAMPPSGVDVAVVFKSGDSDLSVKSGAALSFTTSNWAVPQAVVISAAEDADTDNGSAVFTVSSTGLASVDITATEVEAASAPLPVITEILVPATIVLGEWVDIQVSVRNDGGDSDEGGISISFPGLTGNGAADRAELVAGGSADLVYLERDNGDLIYNKSGSQVPAQYLLVEGTDIDWTSGETNVFKVRVRPESVGAFTVYVRSAMGASGSYYGAPTSGATDQQGWNVQSRAVTVNPTPAEIKVAYNGTDIADGDTSPSVGEGTDFGTITQGGSTVSRTFTVTNIGGSTLNLGIPTLPTGFTLSEPLSGSLAAGASDTFTVRLDSAAAGTKSGDVSFTNNDADEDPFNFAITGVVVADGSDDIAVWNLLGAIGDEALVNGASPVSGISTGSLTRGAGIDPSFATASFSSSGWSILSDPDPNDYYEFSISIDEDFEALLESIHFVERRSGTGPTKFLLTSSLDGHSVAISGSVGTLPDNSNERDQEITLPGEFGGVTGTVVFRLYAYAAESEGGTWRLKNSTGRDGITIRGTVVTAPTYPEISVEYNGMEITDNDGTPSAADGTDFGTVTLGASTISRTFTVTNTGTATLTLGSPEPALNASYSLTEPLAASLAPGESDTFTVLLESTSLGSKSGQISFDTNVSEKNPFNFKIAGEVVEPTVAELVLHLPLDGNALDTSGKGHTTTPTNITYGQDRFGNAESAAWFDNTSAYGTARIKVAHQADLVPEAYTLSMWVKPTNAGYNTNQSWAVLLRKGTFFPYALFLDKTNLKLQTGVYNGSAGTGDQVLSPDPVALNQWYHLATTYKDGTCRLFVNGRLVSETTDAGALPSNVEDISIGSGSFSAISSAYQGWMDDVRLFGYEMSGTQVAGLAEVENQIGTLFLASGGSINGQAVDAGSRTITVSPGAAITGQVKVLANNLMSPGAVVPLGGTVDWGDRTSQPWQTAGDIPQGTNQYTVAVGKTAPTTPGTYHMVIAFAGEYNMSQIMSRTNWTAGAPVWNDGNDVAFDWGAAEFSQAASGGAVLTDMLQSTGYNPYWLPATVVTIEVVPGVEPIDYSEWVVLNPSIPVNLRGMLDDADGDGEANVLEMFHATSPTDGSERGGLSNAKHVESAGGQLTVDFHRSTIVDPSMGTIGWSSDMVTWAGSGQSIDGTIVNVTERVIEAVDTDMDGNADYEVIEVSATVASGSIDHLFLRLKVEAEP